MKRSVVFLFCLFSCFYCFCQTQEIGSWRDHLPTRFVIDIYKNDNTLTCVTEFNFFNYNIQTKEINVFSRSNFLSDVNISCSEYKDNKMIIAYKNCNIDIVVNGAIYNMPDIKNSQILGEKKINEIKIYEDVAYLASSFGIIELDIANLEIKNSFQIDSLFSSVNDVVVYSDTILASSENGLYAASIKSNLSDYNSWKMIDSRNCKKMISKGDEIYISFTNKEKDSVVVLQKDVFLTINKDFSEVQNIVHTGNKIYILDENNIYRIDSLDAFLYWSNTEKIVDLIITEDVFFGSKKDGLITFINNTKDTIFSNSPFTNNVFDMSYSEGKIYVAPGGVNNAWGNINNRDGFFIYDGIFWENFSYDQSMGKKDILKVCPNPSIENNYFIGSWNGGVLEKQEGFFINHNFYNTNGIIDTISIVDVNNWSRVRGMCFDDNNNLWITNSQVENPLIVKQQTNWFSFNFPGLNSSLYNFGEIIIDDIGQKWIVMPKGEGVLVFNDNNSLDQLNDDNYKRINTNYGNGGLSSMDVYSIAKDREGAIWVGTNNGISVFYSPELVFSSFNFDSQKILIEQDGYYEYLLDGQTVSALCVDNANRKWIGTLNNGVFLYDESENEIVKNFNKSNSPLLSNTVFDICVNELSGEVFFGTDNGICSFRGVATKNSRNNDPVFVYPNPVKKNNSYVCVSGLQNNMNVKFTTVNGELVYETTSFGGQAIWNFNKKPVPGVYLVFSTSTLGLTKKIGKFLISEQ